MAERRDWGEMRVGCCGAARRGPAEDAESDACGNGERSGPRLSPFGGNCDGTAGGARPLAAASCRRAWERTCAGAAGRGRAIDTPSATVNEESTETSEAEGEGTGEGAAARRRTANGRTVAEWGETVADCGTEGGTGGVATGRATVGGTGGRNGAAAGRAGGGAGGAPPPALLAPPRDAPTARDHQKNAENRDQLLPGHVAGVAENGGRSGMCSRACSVTRRIPAGGAASSPAAARMRPAGGGSRSTRTAPATSAAP